MKKTLMTWLLGGCFALAAVTAQAAEPRSPDILGMKLGMTPDEIKAALQASDLKFQIREIPMTLKDLPGANWLGSISAIRHGGDARSDEIRVDFPPPPHETRAVLITRLIQYAVNAGPLTREVESALVQKYGKERWVRDRYNTSSELHSAWIDTPAGVRITDPKTRCIKNHWSPRTTDGSHASFNRLDFVDGCGLTVVAMIRGGDPGKPSHPMISGMWTTITDYDLLLRQRNETHAYVERGAQEAASSRGTPKL